MRILNKVLFLGLIIFAGGCGLFSKKQSAACLPEEHLRNVLLADSFFKEEDVRTQACVLPDSANIYAPDSAGSIVKVGCMYLGDTLSVANEALMPFMNMYYTLQWHGRKVYVLGTNLGYKNTDIDFDGDGRPDEIIYGYTAYDTSSTADRLGLHPMWIRFIAADGGGYEVRDSGYSEISVEEIKDSMVSEFSKPTKILEVSSGYPACGYDEFEILVAFRDGKPAVIHKQVSNMDSGYGNFFETILPRVGKGHKDSIYLVEHMNSQADDNSDSIITSSWDSSVIYLSGGKWVSNTFWRSPADSAGN